jgi:hypothetical protein
MMALTMKNKAMDTLLAFCLAGEVNPTGKH